MKDSNFRVKLKIGVTTTLVVFFIVFIITGNSAIAMSFTPYYFIGGVFIVPFLISEFASTNLQIKLLCGEDGVAFIKLAIKLITIDGEINKYQRDKLNLYLQREYGKSILKTSNKYIDENKNNTETISELCNSFAEMSNKYNVDVFYRLFTIAAADKTLTEKEESILKEIAKELRITNQRFRIIKKSLIKESYNNAQEQDERAQQNQSYNSYILEHLLRKAYNPYEVLGIEQNASIEEVKGAYRNLAKLYHPDKSMNESIDKKRQNALKILEINQAYEEIKKMRGIK